MPSKEPKQESLNNTRENLSRLIEKIKKDSENDTAGSKYQISPSYESKGESIDKQIDRSRKEIENEGIAQDIKLKKYTLIILFMFLAGETGVIFTYAYFQATMKAGFMLEEWSFKLLVAATITQITIMLLVAVKHLFPNKN